MGKVAALLVLLFGCGTDGRQDEDIARMQIRIYGLEHDNSRLRDCILRLSTDMRVEDVIEDLRSCLEVRQ